MKRISLYKPAHAKHRASKTFNGRQDIDKMYGHIWEKYRADFLRVNPKCYACSAIATVVDHITPHKGDWYLFWKVDNFCPLCARCHNTITNLFDRRHVPGTIPFKKLEWLSASRQMKEISFRVKVVPFSEEVSKFVLENAPDKKKTP